MSIEDISIRLIIAIICGGAIGLERQWHHKNAGLRTNTLVALGACLYSVTSIELSGTGNADSTRIIGQIVTGVGFLGGGVILREGLSIRGLNTAATIWCSAAIGCMAGVKFYNGVWIATLFIIFINLVFRFIENLFLIENKEKN